MLTNDCPHFANFTATNSTLEAVFGRRTRKCLTFTQAPTDKFVLTSKQHLIVLPTFARHGFAATFSFSHFCLGIVLHTTQFDSTSP